ncbi:hypothetical protein [Glycomyces buryatensis]|uniref:Rpn family recombination-promoting nuclease/putative transposase n=1 Tax=Glycomyces buryatensis TaxID=2570927 RepID=A0A4S8QFZ9_9ACTN|nr:hypothetical protein [Glycomyces buryatensis]THV41865.1 hypothetical protein FAB82_09090 [Glycomyces buryatensis]
MPGDPHELIVQAIQDEPLTAAWLMDLVDMDRRVEVCTAAETRTTSVGSPGRTERRADVVVKLSFPRQEDRIIIVEVQNEFKNEKYYRLPGYMARAFEDHRLPVELVLICPTDSVAHQYSEGIYLGPENTISMRTLGPSNFPELVNTSLLPTAASAVVAAIIGKSPRGRKAELFVSTLDRRLGTIEPGRAADYIMMLTILEDEPAQLLEDLMRTKTRPYHSEYSDRLRSEGREAGLEEGREEGAVLHARSLLVALLEGTQSGITAEQRQRIEACTDREQLDAWIAKFVASGSAAEVFPT